MGVYHVLNAVRDELDANLASHIDEVSGETSGVTLDSSFTIYDRERVLTFYKKSLPGVGVFLSRAQTGAASQKRRDWQTSVGIDYCVEGRDRAELGQQTELVVDAIMRTLDAGLVDGSTTLIGTAEDSFGTSAVTDLDQMLQAQADDPSSQGPFRSAARVEYPVIQREVLP